jgi:DNA-binding HxlR family transcriptional regulator
MEVTDQSTAVDTCPIREILERVGGKWSVQVILETTKGPRRFMELLSAIDGLSRRMLTITLRGLERDGLVERTVYPTAPVTVEYNATELAHGLREPLEALAVWAEQNRATILHARDNYDRRHAAAS